MSLLILSLLIACLFPPLSKLPAVFVLQKQPGGYDNHTPRAQQKALTGFGARAIAAHYNSYESLLFFACGVLTALSTHHDSTSIQSLAIAYLASRLLYHVLYLMDYATLRSLVWTISTLCPLSMIYLCLF